MTDWQSRFREIKMPHPKDQHLAAVDSFNALVDQLAADVAAEVEHADKAVAMLVKSHLCLTPGQPRGCAVCSLLAIHAARRKVQP